MLKLIALALLPLIAGAWSLQGTQLFSGLGISTALQLDVWGPLLLVLVFVLIFLWDGLRLNLGKMRALLPQLLCICLLLVLLSLGRFFGADFDKLLDYQNGESWFLLLGPLALTLVVALSLNFRSQEEITSEEPALEDLTRLPELKKEGSEALHEFLRYIRSSTGAYKAGLVEYREEGIQCLSAQERDIKPSELEELTSLRRKDLHSLPGLGDIPLRAKDQSFEILVPLGPHLRKDLYLAWQHSIVLEGEILQKLIHLRKVLSTLVMELQGKGEKVSAFGFLPLLWNFLLGLVVLPLLLSVGMVMRGESFLIDSIMPWSHGGIPTIIILGVGYYFSLLFTWTGEQRRLSQVWRWHRSQVPSVANLVWINKLRMIRNLTFIAALLGAINAMNNLNRPEKIGPGVAVACIAITYQIFAFLLCLPARTFGTFPLMKSARPNSQVDLHGSVWLSMSLGFLLLLLGLFVQPLKGSSLMKWEVLSHLLFWLSASMAYLFTKISWRAFGSLLMPWREVVRLDLPSGGLRLLWVYCLLGLLSMFGIFAQNFLYLADKDRFMYMYSQFYPLIVLWVCSVLLIIFPLRSRIELAAEEVVA